MFGKKIGKIDNLCLMDAPIYTHRKFMWLAEGDHRGQSRTRVLIYRNGFSPISFVPNTKKLSLDDLVNLGKKISTERKVPLYVSTKYYDLPETIGISIKS